MRLCAACSFAVLALCARSAQAHHVSGPPPRQGADLDTERATLSIDASSARVQLVEQDTVQFTTIAASALVRLQNLTLGARLPMHIVAGSGASGSGVPMGAGDLTLSAGYDLLRSDRFRLSGHMALQLPTGDEEHHLGYGSTAVLPMLRASYRPAERFSIFARAGGVLDAMDSRGHVDPIDQRVGSELRGAVGTSLRWRDHHAGAELFTALPMRGSGNLVMVVPRLSTAVGTNMRLGLFAQLPVYKERAFDWRAGLSWTYQWGRSAPPALVASAREQPCSNQKTNHERSNQPRNDQPAAHAAEIDRGVSQ